MNRLIPYYRARYFSPQIGRFISRDPLGSPLMMANPPSIFARLDFVRNLSDFVFKMYGAKLSSSSSLNWLTSNPPPRIDLSQGPNLYAYVGSNPIDGIDPLGLYDGPPTQDPLYAPSQTSAPPPACPCGQHQETVWSPSKAANNLDFATGGFAGAAATQGAGMAGRYGGSVLGKTVAEGVGDATLWLGAAQLGLSALFAIDVICVSDAPSSSPPPPPPHPPAASSGW